MNIDRTQLTEREQQVLELTAQGLTRAQIAARLGISFDTVRTYRTSISQRWGLPKGMWIADVAWLASIAQKESSK